LLIEECSIHLPVTVLFACAARRCCCRAGLPVEGQGQILVDEAHQSGVDVMLFQLRQHLLVKVPAVGALKIAEFHDGEGCLRGAHGRLAIEQQFGCERRLRWWFRLAGFFWVRSLRRDPALQQNSASTAESKTEGETCDRSQQSRATIGHGTCRTESVEQDSGAAGQIQIQWSEKDRMS
jgi:hypothetical protein